MDVSESISHLICGYCNGFLSLWDLSKTNCIKFMPKEHKSCVIAVKFLRVEINTEMNIRKKDPKKQLPKFENFFGLIDFLEKKNYKKNEEEENENTDKDNIFLLKNYKLNSKKKIEVLKFPPKTTLSSRFFKGGNILTSITANEDVIFTGNNLGIVKVYSCEKEMEYK